jgi:cyclopropane fatty-acyl-phospholipid synthase-like methyltransferase
MPVTRDQIRTYYDQNTRLFLAFNRSRKAENIHRSLWTKNTKTLEEALNQVNEYLLREIETVAPIHARIADLGCGVGASLMYISPRLKTPEIALGITLSTVQARLAGEFTKSSGLDGQISFLEGDFTSVPLANGSLDVIYSVEAVVHAQEPDQYFHEAGRLLRAGGKLILADDYRTARPLSFDESKWLNTFRNGWHLPGVVTVEQATAFAEKHHLRFVKNDNLSPYLRLRNLPSFVAIALLFIGNALPIRHAILPAMLGSLALQQCLSMKVIEYRFLVFEKI